MAKKTNKSKRVPHRVLGKIKWEHINQIAAHPTIERGQTDEIAATGGYDVAALNEEEHVLVAVPKSAWQRFVDWMEGK